MKNDCSGPTLTCTVRAVSPFPTDTNASEQRAIDENNSSHEYSSSYFSDISSDSGTSDNAGVLTQSPLTVISIAPNMSEPTVNVVTSRSTTSQVPLRIFIPNTTHTVFPSVGKRKRRSVNNNSSPTSREKRRVNNSEMKQKILELMRENDLLKSRLQFGQTFDNDNHCNNVETMNAPKQPPVFSTNLNSHTMISQSSAETEALFDASKPKQNYSNSLRVDVDSGQDAILAIEQPAAEAARLLQECQQRQSGHHAETDELITIIAALMTAYPNIDALQAYQLLLGALTRGTTSSINRSTGLNSVNLTPLLSLAVVPTSYVHNTAAVTSADVGLTRTQSTSALKQLNLSPRLHNVNTSNYVIADQLNSSISVIKPTFYGNNTLKESSDNSVAVLTSQSPSLMSSSSKYSTSSQINKTPMRSDVIRHGTEFVKLDRMKTGQTSKLIGSEKSAFCRVTAALSKTSYDNNSLNYSAHSSVAHASSNADLGRRVVDMYTSYQHFEQQTHQQQQQKQQNEQQSLLSSLLATTTRKSPYVPESRTEQQSGIVDSRMSPPPMAILATNVKPTSNVSQTSSEASVTTTVTSATAQALETTSHALHSKYYSDNTLLLNGLATNNNGQSNGEYGAVVPSAVSGAQYAISSASSSAHSAARQFAVSCSSTSAYSLSRYSTSSPSATGGARSDSDNSLLASPRSNSSSSSSGGSSHDRNAQLSSADGTEKKLSQTTSSRNYCDTTVCMGDDTCRTSFNSSWTSGADSVGSATPINAATAFDTLDDDTVINELGSKPDMERYKDRRRRNNEAAKRCRANRRAIFEFRSRRVSQLERENVEMREQLLRLHTELDQLKAMIALNNNNNNNSNDNKNKFNVDNTTTMLNNSVNNELRSL